eukprot:CAMPEP_0185834764 /NCGR_PEP_ID=MMETSP1353-20130828/6169_1 /TAXON_ID=1077150 /ORGANISM="Erythrolobus australicus, Strain CCMP3124" /LENGTH=190 /DNA_ID=CAMNT_0028533259 /DNA_START=54 /DNA_END=623 /DNA_ORIENTATION=-
MSGKLHRVSVQNLLVGDSAPFPRVASSASGRVASVERTQGSEQTDDERSRDAPLLSPHPSEPTMETDTESERSKEYAEKKLKAQNYNKWSREEDELLLSLVDKYGTRRWKLLAERHFPNRGAGSLRSRYVNNLVSSRKRKLWSATEDCDLFAAVKTHGNRWSFLAPQFEGRTANDLKNRMQTLRERPAGW